MPYAHRTQPATGYQKADDRFQKTENRKQMTENRYSNFKLPCPMPFMPLPSAPCPTLYAFTNPQPATRNSQPVTRNPRPATRDSQPATRYLSTTIAIPIPPPMHMEMIPVL